MSEANYYRKIRSFVRREGRITPAQQRALEVLWPRFGLNVDDGVLDCQQAFAREAPCVLEIGFGMGRSLLTMAKQYPEWNFVGIEVHRPGVGALLNEMEKTGLSNIRIYQHDAVEVLQQCIKDNTLQSVLIFFPDPWHKKKHHKRRLIQTHFVQLLYKKLAVNGILHIATDWQDYAEHIEQVMAVQSNFAATELAVDRPQTKFERRGLRLGHVVSDLVFRKLPIA